MKFVVWSLLWLIKIYQKTLSPNKWIFRSFLAHRICAHTPHCSQYCYECIEKHGVWKGLQYGTTRVLSCKASNSMTYDPSSYRVVFFWSAPISVPFLEGLCYDSRYDIVGVVTMPDQPSGRGMKMQANVVKASSQKLVANSLKIVTPVSLRLDSKKYGKEAQDFQKRIEDIKPDLCVVVAYGNIIPQRLLDLPTFWCVNVHGSLLPKYRGASPLQDTFLHNETETGLTIMAMDAGIDTGPMIETLKTKIPHSRTVKNLIDWIKQVGPGFLQETLWSYCKGELIAMPQDESQASHCSKITKEDGLVDIYQDTVQTIYNKWRAYYLWPKTYFKRKRESGKEIQVTIENITIDYKLQTTHQNQIFYEWILSEVWSLKSEVLVKPEWKSAMSWEEFLRGYK